MSKINPGIARTVAWLQERGYNTQDSGDGATHDYECVAPSPYVHIRVEPSLLVTMTHILRGHLSAAGVRVGPMNEDGTAKAIEASYNPADGFGIITLWNVADVDLFGHSEGCQNE